MTRPKETDKRPSGVPTHKRSWVVRLPNRLINTLGKLLGLLAYAVDLRHRRIVKRNLSFIYPEWTPLQVLGLSRRVFQNFGVTFLEICQMFFMTQRDILGFTRVRGKEHFLKSLEHPRGAIMISAHLGNWEMSFQFGSCYVDAPMVAVAREVRPKIVDRWLSRFRTRFGSEVVDKKRALPKMARAVYRGNLLGILVDQGTIPSEGVEVTFLGRTVLATPAAAVLARRYDSPVFPAYCVREPDGRLTLVLEPPLPLQKTQDSRADLQANTQRIMDAIGEAVRAYPDQWFWFHKRWKHYFPELYPEDMAKRQRRREKRWAMAGENRQTLGG